MVNNYEPHCPIKGAEVTHAVKIFNSRNIFILLELKEIFIFFKSFCILHLFWQGYCIFPMSKPNNFFICSPP